ncbi:MAG: TIGR01212 family radical SAM protein [Spirochaetales bacterium]|nr:TIGR01212 family radical SAM protein [Spirochaetales bacterium]
MYNRWQSYPEYLKSKYGHPIYRIGVDGGFSCPNREKTRHGGCAFCDGTGSVAVYQRNTESGFFRNSGYIDEVASRILDRFASIEAQIEKGKGFIKRRYKAEEFALYFQSWTNTYDSADNLKKIYDKALSFGPFREFIISTRPDCLDDDILDLLESYKTDDMEVWVELGLQSSNDETLRRINRGHDAACYMEAAKKLKARGLKISTHVIFGLPGETREDYINTIKWVNKANSDAIKIHNLHVSGGTLLNEEYLEGLFTAASTERHLENTELGLRYLKPDVIVQRLICETPMHRLAAPRHFADKYLFLSHLQRRMEDNGTMQGDLYEA